MKQGYPREKGESMSSLTGKGPLGRRNDRRIGGSPLGRTSQMKKLLSEEGDDSAPVVESNTDQIVGDNPVDLQALLSKLTIDFDEYAYPREEAVPADWYFSTIAAMSVRIKEGKVILDVDYDLEDRFGSIRHIRQSYPVGSHPYKVLSKALVAAGLKKGQQITDAAGTTEMLRVDYVSKNSDLGSIVERKPYVIPPEDEDREFDDFLEDAED